MTARKTESKPKSKATLTAKTRPREQLDDYTIWLPMDGIRLSAPWRLGSYGDDGALSASDLSELADRFDLPASVLEALSKNIGHCLDRETAANLVKVKRSKAIERAQERLEEAARHAKRIESDISKISKQMAGLSDQFKQRKEDSELLRSAKAQVEAVVQASAGLEAAIDLVIKTPGAAAVMTPFNENHVWDKRRVYVVETCCYAWHDAGHKISYTTVSDGSKPDRHGGLLVDFIQDIVLRVTEPAEELSTNTMKKDIDRLRKRLDAPDPLSLPPTKG